MSYLSNGRPLLFDAGDFRGALAQAVKDTADVVATTLGGDATAIDVTAAPYNAVGDGVADDTAAIRAAIAEAESRTAMETVRTWEGLGAGGRVYFPRGIYRITDTITITAPGVLLVGENSHVSSIKADLNDPAKDAIVFTGGRRSGLRDLTIYDPDNRAGTRDLLVFYSTSWWIAENLNLMQAGRYGMRINGTLYGTAIHVRSLFNGDSGLWIGPVHNDVHTTTVFIHFYTGSNVVSGVKIARAHNVSFYNLISEGNARPEWGGTPGAGHGIEIGTLEDDPALVTFDGPTEVNLFAPYFEGNTGWDVYVGTARPVGYFPVVTIVGGNSDGTNKTETAGFLYSERIRGIASGVNLMNMARSFSLEPTSQFTITGTFGNENVSNEPVIRGGSLEGYSGGQIEWGDNDGRRRFYGSNFHYLGGPGGGRPIIVTRGPVPPDSGTWGVGDVCFNTSTVASDPIFWRCTSAGTPGTWTAMYPYVEPPRQPLNYSVNKPNLTPNAGAGKQFFAVVNDGAAFSMKNPTNPTLSQVITVTIYNASGGALGTVTWDSGTGGYKLAGAWVSPANGFSRSVTFWYDGTYWLEQSRTMADVPN